MGYTTNFSGEFHCYRPESGQLGAFLEAIRTGDRAALGPLADWLTEQDDARGPKLAARLPHLGENLELLWTLFGLRLEHATYLQQFSRTRRMRRDPTKAMLIPDPVREATGLPIGEEAGYFTGETGFAWHHDDPSVLDANTPPKGQPGLWCQWVPNEAHSAIKWNGAEKFYYYIEWLKYLMDHFLRPWGYQVNGSVEWKGENEDDRGVIHVRENRITAEETP